MGSVYGKIATIDCLSFTHHAVVFSCGNRARLRDTGKAPNQTYLNKRPVQQRALAGGCGVLGADPIRDRDDPVHFAHHWFFNQLAVDHHQPGVGLFKGLNDLSGAVYFLR